MFLVLTQIIISCNSTKIIDSEPGKNYEKQKNEINHDGIYVSKDTLYSIDKNYRNDVTIRLLKLNKDKTVQISNPYTCREGENKLNNLNLTDWLFSETSYNFTLKGESKLIIECFAKRSKTCWYCWGGPGRVNEISENFKINGDTLIRLKKSNKNFRKKYILDRTLYNNHKKIRIGNACK